ncbi:T6SS effector BTH_I2691 family protein [Limnobaculum parvum]|uniref:Toxin VasX N-terminal region domain-containing protein n=1 Tax=Limnobaculum parvum TaxID=2172103 RepID=A0A2Y9TUM7_9GAMM|nr:T6SS effector BTH_I2691 family protein [Limnobaculum parvum]AWH87259.1 hypothetical protein HYN51_01010 [Limnobaculum parvum]
MTQETNNTASPSIRDISAQVSNNISSVLNPGGCSAKHEGGGCPACKKEGDLFLLPLRYAAVCKEDGFPVLPLPNGAEGKFSAMPLTASSYSTQMLREGFLYVLEERASSVRWRGFTVSAEGCLNENDPEKLPDIPPKFACDITTDGVNAACINFQNSDQINLISMIFSPDKMTQSRLDYFQGEGKAELQKITPDQIKSAANTSDQKRLDVIKPEDLLSHVLEFYLADFSKKKYDSGGHIAKRFYNTQSRIEEIENISGTRVPKLNAESINKPYSDMLFSVPAIDMTTSRYPKLTEVLSKHNGAGIVMSDAIGITQSLSDWRNKAYDEFLKDWFDETDNEGFSNEDKYIIYLKIKDLQTSYAQKRVSTATKQAIDNAKAQFDDMKEASYISGMEMSDEQRQKILDYIAKDTTGRLSTVDKTAEYQDEFQQKYWSQLDPAKLSAFEDELNKRTLLANLHTLSRDKDILLWLKSPQLVKHLNVYEQEDLKNSAQGVRFSEQVGRCIFGISSSPLLAEALDVWWRSDFVDEGNLCLRAYFFNQTNAQEYLNNIITVAAKDLSIPDQIATVSVNFDSLLTLFGQVDDMVDKMQIKNSAVSMLTVVFADLTRATFRGAAVNVFDRLLVGRFTNMVIASIGQRAVQLNILDQLGKGVSQVERGLAERSGAYARSYVRDNLARSLENPKIGNFYKVRLNGALAVLESVILINLIGHYKGEGKDYLVLTAAVTTLSATAFTVYSSYIELAYLGSSVKVRESAGTFIGKFSFWGGTLNFIAGGALAISDFIDAKNNTDNSILFTAYGVRMLAITAYTVFRYTIAIEASSVWFEYVSKTAKKGVIRFAAEKMAIFASSEFIKVAASRMLVWVPYLNLLIVAVTIGMCIFEPNALETWFKRCCFGTRALKDKYQNLQEEMGMLSSAVQECI